MSISHSFDFHGVARIVLGPVISRSGFVARHIYLIDDKGEELDIPCYSDGRDIPVRVDEDEEGEEDEPCIHSASDWLDDSCYLSAR